MCAAWAGRVPELAVEVLAKFGDIPTQRLVTAQAEAVAFEREEVAAIDEAMAAAVDATGAPADDAALEAELEALLADDVALELPSLAGLSLSEDPVPAPAPAAVPEAG